MVLEHLVGHLIKNCVRLLGLVHDCAVQRQLPHLFGFGGMECLILNIQGPGEERKPCSGTWGRHPQRAGAPLRPCCSDSLQSAVGSSPTGQCGVGIRVFYGRLRLTYLELGSAPASSKDAIIRFELFWIARMRGFLPSCKD